MGAAPRISGPLGQAVQEVLEAFLSPALSQQVLADALDRARRRSFPENPWSASELIEGPLKELIVELFGAETANFVVQDLAPVLQMASSGVRRRSRGMDASGSGPAPESEPVETLRPVHGEDGPYASPTRPVLVDDADLPSAQTIQVLVATAAPALPSELLSVVGSSEVQLVRDAFELFTLIETRRSAVWVVLDGHRPTVDVKTLAAFLGSLPPDCRVLLWGCDSRSARRLVEKRAPVWSTIEVSERWTELGVTLRAMIAAA